MDAGGGLGGGDASVGSGGTAASGDGGASGEPGRAGGAGVAGEGGATCAVRLDSILTFNLRSGAFPNSGYPDVAVHVPPGFLPCDRPGLIAYLPGWAECAQIALGSVNGPCGADGAVHVAYNLAEQLDAAQVNAILVVIQLQPDVASGDPGQLANPDGFANLLHELLTEKLSPLLGQPIDTPDLDRVVVGSFSGGYQAVSSLMAQGVVPLHEIDLYDSLYGNVLAFQSWIESQITTFDGTRAGHRFVDVYTRGGGTLSDSEQLAAWLESTFGDAGLAPQLLTGATAASLTQSDYGHAAILAVADLSHGDVPRTYLGPLARASGFRPLP
jgi:hypothetical protein